jgi:hypothetical protein
MRLSGVDPGIIRELSGIYKPFIKAFKELISNAYDADAETITVRVAEDFQTIEVQDDGIGMTPFHFESDFARLGGSTAWLGGGRSPGGRPRIGYKGIGFLAVARYCSELHLTSHADRPYEGSRVIQRRGRKAIPLDEIFGDVVPLELLKDRIKTFKVEVTDGSHATALKRSQDFVVNASEVRLASKRSHARELTFQFAIDCSHLMLDAVLDFDYLLGLERKEDLRTLDDFCKVKVRAVTPKDRPVGGALEPFTTVRLKKLKDFVVRELTAPAVKGKQKSIIFKGGREQFLWRLARSSPICDDVPEDIEAVEIEALAKKLEKADLPTVRVKWGKEDMRILKREVYLPQDHGLSLADTVFPIDVNEGGLRVVGYLLARSEVIYPAELRGLCVRVRHVAIGDASFLGWEHILSGPRKAALSQISGELLVLEGLEASDAINPGRESFYEENPQYRILKRVLFGTGDVVGGAVGKAINTILDRIRVRSQVNDRITEAKQRSQALADIASAVSHYAQSNSAAANGLTAFFDSKKHRANGLSLTKDVPLKPGPRLGGFEVEASSKVADEGFHIDYSQKKVRFDFRQDPWKTTVYLRGHYYDVHLKQGKPEHPICEFDNETRSIYVNWAHPAKLHMNDVAFLKSAILLRLAYHASPTSAETMMDLALNLLAFRAE